MFQGSSLVHDRIRAPVWFVDSFIKGLFNHFAMTKAVDITNFNTAVHDMLTNHLQKISSQSKCGSCASLFGGRSIPEVCNSCKKMFHKSCFQDKRHPCCKRLATNYSLPTSSSDPPTRSLSAASSYLGPKHTYSVNLYSTTSPIRTLDLTPPLLNTPTAVDPPHYPTTSVTPTVTTITTTITTSQHTLLISTAASIITTATLLDQQPQISIQFLNPNTLPFYPTPPNSTAQPPQYRKQAEGRRIIPLPLRT